MTVKLKKNYPRMMTMKSLNFFFSPRLMHIPENAVLGRGSFGTVWRARDAHTGRCYAATWC